MSAYYQRRPAPRTATPRRLSNGTRADFDILQGDAAVLAPRFRGAAAREHSAPPPTWRHHPPSTPLRHRSFQVNHPVAGIPVGSHAPESRRLAMWGTYHQWFAEAERAGKLRLPIVPAHCVHNAHMYYVLLPDLRRRTAAIDKLKALGVDAVFHYVPLHSAPAGKKYGRAHGAMNVTDDIADRLLRLPMWVGMEDRHSDVIQAVLTAL